MVSALVGGTLQLQWKVRGSNPSGGECETVEDGMVEGLTLFFPVFSPWLIMNLLCKGKGSAATSLFVPFSGDP